MHHGVLPQQSATTGVPADTPAFRPWPTQQCPFQSAQLRQLLFREKCFGHERIQMVRVVYHATTTSKIAVDSFIAAANCSFDLPAGHALKPRLDCQSPYVVAWTIPFHSALNHV